MPLATPRPGLLAASAIAAALVAASTSFGSAEAGSGCAPIVRTLQNGDPAVTDGALRVTVDGLGAFGRGAVGAGDAASTHPAAFAPGTTYTSNLYLSSAGRMLADDCVDGQVELLSESPLTTRLTIGSLRSTSSSRSARDARQLDAAADLHAHEHGRHGITAHLVRHLDGDLRFDSSTDDGARPPAPTATRSRSSTPSRRAPACSSGSARSPVTRHQPRGRSSRSTTAR